MFVLPHHQIKLKDNILLTNKKDYEKQKEIQLVQQCIKNTENAEMMFMQEEILFIACHCKKGMDKYIVFKMLLYKVFI